MNDIFLNDRLKYHAERAMLPPSHPLPTVKLYITRRLKLRRAVRRLKFVVKRVLT